jgi:hypothetical protein
VWSGPAVADRPPEQGPKRRACGIRKPPTGTTSCAPQENDAVLRIAGELLQPGVKGTTSRENRAPEAFLPPADRLHGAQVAALTHAFRAAGQTMLRGTAVDDESLEFYSMPRASAFSDFKDGCVGYNFLTLVQLPDGEPLRLAKTVSDATHSIVPTSEGAVARDASRRICGVRP